MCDEWMVEQEQVRTECGEKASRFHDLKSTVRREIDDKILGEGRLVEFVSILQLLYKDSRKVLVLAGPSSQVVEDDPHVRELKSQAALK